jgi:hypothetical protein
MLSEHLHTGPEVGKLKSASMWIEHSQDMIKIKGSVHTCQYVGVIFFVTLSHNCKKGIDRVCFLHQVIVKRLFDCTYTADNFTKCAKSSFRECLNAEQTKDTLFSQTAAPWRQYADRFIDELRPTIQPVPSWPCDGRSYHEISKCVQHCTNGYNGPGRKDVVEDSTKKANITPNIFRCNDKENTTFNH